MPDAVEQHRHRFTVPETDAAVCAWVAAQSNLSLSLRLVIRECIQAHGYADVFAEAMDAGAFAVPVPEPPAQPAPKAPVSRAQASAARQAMDSGADRIARMQGGAARSLSDMLNG